jgi:hypothetical protein
MQKIKFVDPETEYEVIDRLCKEVYVAKHEDFHPGNTVILNVSPDYSSTVAMRMSHAMSADGEIMEMINIDVPYPDELDVLYKQEFFLTLRHLKKSIKKFILVEAAVLSGKNYTWMVNMMLDEGIAPENIVTTAAFQRHDSVFYCEYVGEEFNQDMIEFYWERYNKHWDNA